MRKVLISVACLIVVISGLIPFIDGYLFKKIYLNQFQLYQQFLYQNNNVQLQMTEYHLGWLSSTTKATITIQDETKDAVNQMPPLVFHVDSVIHHGPIIRDSIKNKYTVAYAAVDSGLFLPDVIKKMLPNNTQRFMQIYSLVPFDGVTWSNHYQIPLMSFEGGAKWNGVTGDMIVTNANQIPVRLQGNFIFGAVIIPQRANMPLLPDISVSPFLYTFDASRNTAGNWNGVSKLTSTGFSAKWQDGRILSGSTFALDSGYGEADNVYHFNEQVGLDSLNIPAPAPVETFTHLKHQFSLSYLSAAGVKNYLGYVKEHQLNNQNSDEVMHALLGMLTPSSKLYSMVSTDTNLGASMADLTMTLQAMPTNKNEMMMNINMNLNARAAKPLVEAVLTFYFTQLNPPPVTESPKQSDTNTNVYVDTIADLLKTQKLTLNDSLALVDLIDQNLGAEALDAKLKQMLINPEAIERLKSSYAETLAKKQGASAATASQADNDPATRTKKMLDSLMQEGFIVIDKDDYVTTFSKQGNVFTLNGKDVSAQFAGVMPAPAMQSNAPVVSDATIDANVVIGKIQTMMSIANKLAAASGSYVAANLTTTTVTAFVPQGGLTTPWGGTIAIGNVTQDAYTITISDVPPATCLAIKAKLDTQLTSNSPQCNMADTTDLMYTVTAPVTLAPVTSPAATTQ